MTEDKGFKPSKKKLDKARKEGKVLKSQLVTQLPVLLLAIVTLLVLSKEVWVATQMLLKCLVDSDSSMVLAQLRYASAVAIRVSATVLGAACIGAIVMESLQVGIRIDGSIAGLRSERLSPTKGAQGMFSGCKQLWFIILRFATMLVALGVVGVSTVMNVADALVYSPYRSMATIESGLLKSFGVAMVLMVVFAGIDYLIKRKAFYRELSMSIEEVRREFKEDEGDPLIKSLRRSIHRSVALNDLARRVRKARVIVVERSNGGTG